MLASLALNQTIPLNPVCLRTMSDDMTYEITAEPTEEEGARGGQPGSELRQPHLPASDADRSA